MTGAAMLASCLTAAYIPAYATSTEYAVRWDPGQSKSAPQTAAEAANRFGVQDSKAKTSKVQYLDIKQPPSLPEPDVRAIARERNDSDGPESMYKVRGSNAGATPAALQGWACPLKGKQKPKLEIDVTWVSVPEEPSAQFQEREAISYSCSVDGPASAAFPAEFAATPLPCSSKVSRLKQEDKEDRLEGRRVGTARRRAPG